MRCIISYLKIPNLYKATDILLLKEVFCSEKLDGSSGHISFDGKDLRFFSGCAKQEDFEALFNKNELLSKFAEMYNENPITIFGEVIGGKIQKMSSTYGKSMSFVAFDVKIGDTWLSVIQAEQVVKFVGLEFVHYVKTSTDLDELNRERDRDSVQAIRNGMGPGHPSEGIVIRPLIELTKNNGERLIAKHKKDNFRETKSVKPVNEDKLEVLREAQAVTDKWVTEMRLNHVIDKLNVKVDVVHIPLIIRSMLEDIRLESVGEIEWSKECEKSVGKATADLVKSVCRKSLV